MWTLRRLFVLALLFLWTACYTNSAAQQYYTRHLTIKDGLPSNKIQSIFKDSRGYIWIGTEAGLCRFDGVNFKVYTTKDGLAGNRIWSITEDDSGNLWFACYGNGISMFDGRAFHNLSEKDGLVNNNVRKVEYSKRFKGLMIGTVYGFSFYKDSTFTSFKDSTVTNRNLLQVTAFLETDSLIYLFTYYDNKQFIVFNPRNKTFSYLPKNHRYHYLSNLSTCAFITSKRDTLIGYSLVGMKFYTKDSMYANTKVGQVFDIAEDKTGTLWFASWSDNLNNRINKGGIYCYKNRREEYYSDKLGITNQECWCLYYDRNENMLWIGTIGSGLYLYPMSGIDYTPATTYSSARPQINDIFIDSKNREWLSVGNRILKNGRSDNAFSSSNFQSAYTLTIREREKYLLDKEGCYSKYQKLISEGRYKYPNPYKDENSISPKGANYSPTLYNAEFSAKLINFYKFAEDSLGRVWVGSNIGLFTITKPIATYLLYSVPFSYFFESSRTLNLLTQYNMSFYSIPDARLLNRRIVRKNATWSSSVRYIKENDFFWLYSNSDGVAKYKAGKLTQFPYLAKQIDLEFNALCLDADKHLIAGTNTGKVYILTYRNDSLLVSYQLSEADGLVGSEIGWLRTDRHNRLWIGTNKGLNMVNLPQLYKNGKAEVSYYNSENGYFDYTTTKAVLDSTGCLLVMSKDNLFRINPDMLVQSTGESPKLVWDKIEIDFREFDWRSIGPADRWSGLPRGEIALPYTDNTLTFYFHLQQYLEPTKVLYSFKLESVQQNWSPYTSEPKAVFTNLPHGKYRLLVRARLLSSPGKTTRLALSFTIHPPWWETFWFYGGVVLLLLLFIYGLFAYRLRVANEKSKIDQRVSELKLEALKAQMNPHFIFNAFSSLQLYILKKDIKNALDYMNLFATLIRKMLEYSSNKKIRLSEEIDFLENYLFIEQKRISNLSFSFVVDPAINTETTFLPPMMVQPLIENALLHGIRHNDKAGRITIEFRLENEHHLRCIVEDNGIGRAKSAEIYAAQQKTYSSRSTAITEERISLLNSSGGETAMRLEYTDLFENGKAAGTRAELVILI